MYPRNGDRIHVEFDATVRLNSTGGPNATTFIVADGTPEGYGGTVNYLYLGDPSLFKVIELPKSPEPEFWPPKVGEVWLHGPSDLVYVVRANTCYEGSVVFTRNNGGEHEIYVPNPEEVSSHYADQAVPSEWERKLRASAG